MGQTRLEKNDQVPVNCYRPILWNGFFRLLSTLPFDWDNNRGFHITSSNVCCDVII